jgi:co-chaperonin GroES (HSP10)
MIRPIGARVLVKPVDQSASSIELTDPDHPQVASVVAVGTPRCEDCRSRVETQISVGQRVLLKPTAIVNDITVDGDTLWMVALDDVLGEVEPLEAHA